MVVVESLEKSQIAPNFYVCIQHFGDRDMILISHVTEVLC